MQVAFVFHVLRVFISLLICILFSFGWAVSAANGQTVYGYFCIQSNASNALMLNRERTFSNSTEIDIKIQTLMYSLRFRSWYSGGRNEISFTRIKVYWILNSYSLMNIFSSHWHQEHWGLAKWRGVFYFEFVPMWSGATCNWTIFCSNTYGDAKPCSLVDSPGSLAADVNEYSDFKEMILWNWIEHEATK